MGPNCVITRLQARQKAYAGISFKRSSNPVTPCWLGPDTKQLSGLPGFHLTLALFLRRLQSCRINPPASLCRLLPRGWDMGCFVSRTLWTASSGADLNPSPASQISTWPLSLSSCSETVGRGFPSLVVRAAPQYQGSQAN